MKQDCECKFFGQDITSQDKKYKAMQYAWGQIYGICKKKYYELAWKI